MPSTEARETKPAVVSSKTVNRLFSILDCLAESRGLMKIQDISHKLDINQPTIHRYLAAMVECGYVYQDTVSLRYGLTMKICRLASEVSSSMNMNMRMIILPHLLEISRQMDTGSCFAVIQGTDAYYIDAIDKPSAIISSLMRIGKDAPLHSSGSGKIFLSQFTPSEIDEFIQLKGLPALTANTITSKETLLEELADIRSKGYAIDREECDPGVTCVSVPVYNYTGKIMGAMSAYDSTDEFTHDRKVEALIELQERAITISTMLGCSDYPVNRFSQMADPSKLVF